MEPSAHVEVVGESTAAAESVADPQSGQIRIMSDRCKTCILNPAERRILIAPDRLRGFLAEAREAEGHVVCHRTLPDGAPIGVQPAMCRGFTDAYGLPPAVREALALGLGSWWSRTISADWLRSRSAAAIGRWLRRQSVIGKLVDVHEK